MLALIRINLVGRATGGSKKGGGSRRGLQLPDIPNVGILLFALFLVMEGAAFFLWQTSASDEATRATSRLQLRKKEIAELEKTKTAIAATAEEVAKLESQKLVFDVLLAEKQGPVGAMHYLSFMLQPRVEAETSADELKAMEAAGWRVAWDARKAWFTGYRESNGDVTLTGEALGHEDVAEVQRRLESSPYFRSPKLVFQEKKRDDKLGVSYVEFSIRAQLVYLIEPKNLPEPEPGAEGGAAAEPVPGAAELTPGQEQPMIGAKVEIPLPPTPSAADAGAADAGDTDALDASSGAGAADAVDVQDAAPAAAPDVPPQEPAKPAPPPAPAKAPPGVDKAPLPTAPQSAPPPAAEAADKLPPAE